MSMRSGGGVVLGTAAAVTQQLSGLVLASSSSEGTPSGGSVLSAAHVSGRESRGGGRAAGGGCLSAGGHSSVGAVDWGDLAGLAWAALQAASVVATEFDEGDYSMSARGGGAAPEKRRLSQSVYDSMRGAGAVSVSTDALAAYEREETTCAIESHGITPRMSPNTDCGDGLRSGFEAAGSRFVTGGGGVVQTHSPLDADSLTSLVGSSKRLRLDSSGFEGDSPMSASSPLRPSDEHKKSAFAAVPHSPTDSQRDDAASARGKSSDSPSRLTPVKSSPVSVKPSLFNEIAALGAAAQASSRSPPSPAMAAPSCRRVGAAAFLPIVEPSLAPFFNVRPAQAALGVQRARTGAAAFVHYIPAAETPIPLPPSAPSLTPDHTIGGARTPASPLPNAAGGASASLSPSASGLCLRPTSPASDDGPVSLTPLHTRTTPFAKLHCFVSPVAGRVAPSGAAAVAAALDVPLLGSTLDPGMFLDAAAASGAAAMDVDHAMLSPTRVPGLLRGCGVNLFIELPPSSGRYAESPVTPAAVDPAILAATGGLVEFVFTNRLHSPMAALRSPQLSFISQPPSLTPTLPTAMGASSSNPLNKQVAPTNELEADAAEPQAR